MDYSLSAITINQILIFLAVAETGGFLKASQTLHLSQSAVSKSIAKLEKDLELTLFQRTTRELKITKEGRQLYEAWKPQILSLQTAYRDVYETAQETNNCLKIGLLNTVLPSVYFNDLQRSFEKQYPDIGISLLIESIRTLETMLKDGALDIVFIPDFEHYTLDEEHLEWMWFQKKHASVILSVNHPLASKKIVCMKDLLSEKFASLKDYSSNNYERDLTERFAAYGAVPDISVPYSSPYSLRNFFRPKQEIAFVDQFFDYAHSEDTTAVLVSDELNGIICGWRPSDRKPVRAFLQCMKENAVIEE